MALDLNGCVGATARMDRKDSIDFAGSAALTVFAILLAFNQVVIKLSTDGFQPVFMAGLRSVGAAVVIALWMVVMRRGLSRGVARSGLLLGLLFSFEFICLYVALDLTTVSRASIIFYSMPVHLALIAHFTLPGERLSPRRLSGLALAMAGVVLVMSDRSNGQADWRGDVAALMAAFGWAGIALTVRLTPISRANSETQLLWQLVVSAPILLGVSLFWGPLLRAPEPLHYAGLAFQILAIASFGFLFWFWLIKIYPASSVASFSFLSPVFSVLMGWAILDERIGPPVWGALALVAIGLVLINRKRRVKAVST